MDELVRLRQFRPAAAPSAAARAQGMLALRTVVGGRRRRTPRPLIVVAAIIAAAALATAAYAIYQSVIVGSPAPANVKNIVRLQTQVKGELIPRAHANPGHRGREDKSGRRDHDIGRPGLPVGRAHQARRFLRLPSDRRSRPTRRATEPERRLLLWRARLLRRHPLHPRQEPAVRARTRSRRNERRQDRRAAIRKRQLAQLPDHR